MKKKKTNIIIWHKNMARRIDLLKPTYDKQTKKELLEVLDSGWVTFGSKTLEFENKFAEYVGAKYAIATNSCTSALDLCLKVYNIKGGELITPAFTFVSDALVGEWNGMDVTFADIDPNTFCIDPNSLVITPETKAIIAVDCHGRLANIDGIRKKCSESGIKPIIIEDAAHAMFTPGVGKGDIVVYSFQAVKSMPIFDGGMITTNDEAIYKKLRTLTWLGIEKLTYDRVQDGRYTWKYDIKTGDGIKAYMTDVQAVIGLGQLRRLSKLLAKRQRIQAKYNKAFKGYDWFVEPLFSHTVQYYTAQFKNRDGLCEYLAQNGIHTSVHFMPLSEFTYWKKAIKRPIPNTEVWLKILSLPVHDALTMKDQETVIKKVKQFYA
jgi:dTDP-4-amino-4,6-dideoxygalactose transaminase